MPTSVRGLRVLDVLGVFYRGNEGRLMVADEFEGTREVQDILQGFVGEDLRILLHHRPLEPHMPERWGGGSCFFEKTGHCPFGHHDRPQDLFTVQASGVLQFDDTWWVSQREERVELQLDHLVGHRAQILVLRSSDTGVLGDKIRTLQEDSLEGMGLEELTEKMRSTKDLLEMVNHLKDGIDV